MVYKEKSVKHFLQSPSSIMRQLYIFTALYFVCTLLTRAHGRNVEYVFLNEQMSFDSAEKACQQRFGGHLASISNVMEQTQAMKAVIVANGMDTNTHVWIGLNETSYNELEWVDNTTVTYSNFAEPLYARYGTCVQMRLQTRFWYPDNCNLKFSSICIVTTPEPVPVCESGWTWFDKANACYKVIRGMHTFFEYQTQCRDVNARMASIHSQAENDFIVDLAKEGEPVDNSNKQVFIGLRRIGENSTVFRWTDGTPFDFDLWAKDEPNNKHPPETCVQVYADDVDDNIPPTPYVHMWNDLVCNIQMRAAVCKKAAAKLN